MGQYSASNMPPLLIRYCPSLVSSLYFDQACPLEELKARMCTKAADSYLPSHVNLAVRLGLHFEFTRPFPLLSEADKEEVKFRGCSIIVCFSVQNCCGKEVVRGVPTLSPRIHFSVTKLHPSLYLDNSFFYQDNIKN